jgi:hypothetical protein
VGPSHRLATSTSTRRRGCRCGGTAGGGVKRGQLPTTGTAAADGGRGGGGLRRLEAANPSQYRTGRAWRSGQGPTGREYGWILGRFRVLRGTAARLRVPRRLPSPRGYGKMPAPQSTQPRAAHSILLPSIPSCLPSPAPIPALPSVCSWFIPVWQTHAASPTEAGKARSDARGSAQASATAPQPRIASETRSAFAPAGCSHSHRA